MSRYFVGRKEVGRTQALRVWTGSRTYWDANPSTRDCIFPTVEQGRSDHGEVEHLAEAGVRIEKDATND